MDKECYKKWWKYYEVPEQAMLVYNAEAGFDRTQLTSWEINHDKKKGNRQDSIWVINQRNGKEAQPPDKEISYIRQ